MSSKENSFWYIYSKTIYVLLFSVFYVLTIFSHRCLTLYSRVRIQPSRDSAWWLLPWETLLSMAVKVGCWTYSWCLWIYIVIYLLADIAVSAPNEDNGAVYIFHGSNSTVSDKYIQRIAASDFKNIENISLFGQSITGGVDVDNNGYPGENSRLFLSLINKLFYISLQNLELGSINMRDYLFILYAAKCYGDVVLYISYTRLTFILLLPYSIEPLIVCIISCFKFVFPSTTKHYLCGAISVIC